MISAADLVSYCDAEQLGDDAEDLLVELETYYVATLEQQLGISLVDPPAARTVYRDGGGYSIWLPEIPVSVTSVSTVSSVGDDFSALDAGNYTQVGRRITLTDGSLFPNVPNSVRAVYVAGYNGASWQLPLRRLILNTVNWAAKIGRKASVEELLKAGTGVPGWNETVALFRRPIY